MRLRYFGGRSSPSTQPAESDFRGSGTVTVSVKLHLAHSKVRLSLRPGTGKIRTSIMRVWQRGQCGRSIAVSGGNDAIILRPGRREY